MRIQLFIILSCFPIIIKAQYTITGKILDTNQNPIENVHIKIKGKETFHTYSNATGVFSVTNLPNGKYNVKIFHIGFETKSMEIQIEKDKYLSVELEEKSYTTEEIVITAIRGLEHTPISQTLVEKEKINAKNLGQDLTFLLNNTPSLVVTSDAGTGIGYSGLRIRGTSSSRINVTINGIPLNDAESQEVYWVDLPDLSSSIDNIQIQRGVGTSTNGSSNFGASINVKTNTLYEKAFAKAEVSTGTFSTLKQTYLAGTGLLKNKFSTDIRLSEITSDGFINRAKSNLKSYFIQVGYKLPNSVLKLLVFSGKEKTYQAWDGIPSTILQKDRRYNGQGKYTDSTGAENYYENQTDNYNQTHWQLMYAASISPKIDANIVLHYTKGKGYYESYRDDKKYTEYNLVSSTTIDKTDFVDQRWLDNDFWGGIFSIHLKKSKLHTIVGGGWNTYIGKHFGKVIWAEYGNIPINYEWYRNKGEKIDFKLYAKVNFLLSSKLNFFTDLQYRTIDYKINGIDNDQRNLTQSHNFNFFQPIVGFRYQFNSTQFMYSNFAIAHREPSRNNFVDANPSLPKPESEKLTNIELGYSYRKNHFALSSNFYYMKYKDQLVLTGEINDVGSAVMSNVPKSHRLGIELVGDITLFQELKWHFNATFSRNKIKDFVVYVDDWDNFTSQREEKFSKSTLSFSPEIIANSIIRFNPFKNFSVNLSSQYVSEQYIDNTKNEDRKLNAYFVHNINLSYEVDVFKKCTVKLLINNLFNEKYETNAWVYRYFSGNKEYKLDGYFPQANTHFLLGVGLHF